MHFNHANIIKFDNRPYDSVQEMESQLVNNWNSVVKSGDTVYILGDFCWSFDTTWEAILKQLNGNKVLIRGNHDPTRFSGKLKKYFQDIKDIKEINDGEYKVVMCHYPLMFYPRAYNEKTIMLCGHVHTTRENELLEKWRTEMRNEKVEKNSSGCSCGRIINVGCMMPWMNFTPATLEQILERTKL